MAVLDVAPEQVSLRRRRWLRWLRSGLRGVGGSQLACRRKVVRLVVRVGCEQARRKWSCCCSLVDPDKPEGTAE
jgi:hypothetical protein